MEVLARWLVQQPLHIALVALPLLAAWALLRRQPRRAKALLVAGVGWLAYAAWEWVVLARTPEANIRVDLLVIWPLIAILTVRTIVRAALPPKAGTPGNGR